MKRAEAQQRVWSGVFVAYLVLLIVVILSRNVVATYIVLAPLMAFTGAVVVGMLVWIGQGIYALVTGKVED